MAFTQQNEKDGYLFFAIAFNAVPGKTYAAQVVAAYESGMTTQQIVNEFTTKTAFTDIYGANLSNADFAQSFVTNVTAGLNTPIASAVQAQAIADIVAALDAGLSIGDVIFNVITNISNKSTADAEWGPLVQMLANKVAVAEALTEGEYALDTTDAGALQGPLALVSEDYATVADAIAKGGALKALLANALAADKAVEDYADGLGLLDNNDDPITGSAAVETELGDRLDDAVADAGLPSGTYAVFAAKTATQQSQEIATAKTNAANQVALDQDALTAANANVAKVATLAKKGADWQAAVEATKAADKAAALSEVEVGNQVNVFNVGKTVTTSVSIDGDDEFVINSVKVITLKADGTFEFSAAATTAQKTALAAVLKAANDDVAADKAAAAALAAENDAEAAVDALDAAANTAVPGSTAQGLLGAVTTAKTDLEASQKAVTDLDAALADLTAYAAQLKQLDSLQEAATKAGDKLVDAGYTLEDLDGTAVAVGATKAIFLLAADSVTGTSTTGAFESGDGIYVGSGYTLNTTADLTKGNNSALEVFFKTNGANTDVYIEQKAFGSGVAGAANGVNGDIIKVTITGVTADKLVFQDGLITVAA